MTVPRKRLGNVSPNPLIVLSSPSYLPQTFFLSSSFIHTLSSHYTSFTYFSLLHYYSLYIKNLTAIKNFLLFSSSDATCSQCHRDKGNTDFDHDRNGNLRRSCRQCLVCHSFSLFSLYIFELF